MWCPTEESLFYWNYMEERTQWEAPPAEAELPAERPATPAPEEEVEESTDDDDPSPDMPPRSLAAPPVGGEGTGQRDRPMQIRVASVRYLTQEARATRETWVPEPTPRSVEDREESPSTSFTR